MLEGFVYLALVCLLGHPSGHSSLLQTHQHVLLVGEHRHSHHGHAMVQRLQDAVHAAVSEEQHCLGMGCSRQDTGEGAVVRLSFRQCLIICKKPKMKNKENNNKKDMNNNNGKREVKSITT